MATAAKKTWHIHCCRGCRTRYEDTCASRGEDELCSQCRGGRGFQLLIDNAKPRLCCLASRLATKAEKETYRLAGRSNWQICPTCKRTQGYKITEQEIVE